MVSTEMDKANQPSKLSKVAEDKLYEYQFGLISRRWNVFIGYLLANGLTLNLVSFSGSKDSGGVDQAANHYLKLSIALSAIALSGLFLQLINLLSRRVTRTSEVMQEHGLFRAVRGIKQDPSHVFTVTGLLYFIITVLAIPWFISAWLELGKIFAHQAWQLWITMSLVGLYVLNLKTLTWPSAKHTGEEPQNTATAQDADVL